MTKELRDVLMQLVKDDGGIYHLVTVEYPCDEHGGMKTVTRMVESDEYYMDIYRADGTTQETRSFFSAGR